MPNIGNITVYDGAATPVAHTLVAETVSRENGVVTCVWREKLASLPDEAQLCLTLRRQKLKSGVVKSVFTMDVPVMESVSGQNSSGYTAAPKVAYVNRNEWHSFSHPRSDITGRRLARQLLVNISNNISASVAAATSGAMPDAVDQLLAPT